MPDRYTHNIPINFPLLFIILGMINIPLLVFIGRLFFYRDIWDQVLKIINYSDIVIIFVFMGMAVDFVFIGLGIWVLWNRERPKPTS